MESFWSQSAPLRPRRKPMRVIWKHWISWLIAAFLLLMVMDVVMRAQEPPPGTPVYTLVGGLQCGLRLLGGTTAQAWCFDSAGVTLLYNGIAVVSTGSGSATFAFSYAEASVTVNAIAMQRSTGISWDVWRPSPGDPIQFQIFSGFCSVAVTGTLSCSPPWPSPQPSQFGIIQ